MWVYDIFVLCTHFLACTKIQIKSSNKQFNLLQTPEDHTTQQDGEENELDQQSLLENQIPDIITIPDDHIKMCECCQVKLENEGKTNK